MKQNDFVLISPGLRGNTPFATFAKEMKSKLALISFFALIVACFFLSRATSDRTRLAVELSAARDIANLYKAQLDTLSTSATSAPDLARLRSDQRDAIKLRGEVTSLREALAVAERAANAKLAASPSASHPDAGSTLQLLSLPEDNPEVRVYKTTVLSTQVPAGNSLMVGGWQTQPGKRLFALVHLTADLASGTITVTSRWAEIPNEIAERLRFGTFLDTSGNQSAALKQFSADDFSKALENETGVDLLSAPVLSSLSGHQGRISVSDPHKTTAGLVDFGQQLDIVPTLAEDGKVAVTLRAAVILPQSD